MKDLTSKTKYRA